MTERRQRDARRLDDRGVGESGVLPRGCPGGWAPELTTFASDTDGGVAQRRRAIQGCFLDPAVATGVHDARIASIEPLLVFAVLVASTIDAAPGGNRGVGTDPAALHKGPVTAEAHGFTRAGVSGLELGSWLCEPTQMHLTCPGTGTGFSH